MKSFSELTSASYVSNSDILAISQENSGTYSSKKTTVKEVSDFANQNFAEEYDSTSSYAVGDYCIYESVLYKCIGTTTGAFDSTKWTSVVVTDEMGQGGGGTGGHTIIDENGNSMTARAGLQFTGGANVSDDSTNDKTIVDLASAGGIDGVFIDTGNVIQASTPITSSADVSYTATEDCAILFAIASDSNNSANIKINDIVIWEQFDTNGINQFSNYLFVKKGQIIKFHHTFTGASGSYTVYGIQTGTTHSKFQPVIYSTEEREIGVWTDGKPLYEKTLELSSIPSTSPILIDVSALNIDIMASAIGEVYAISNGVIVETIVLPAYISQSYYGAIRFLNDNVQILHTGLGDYSSGKIVIQYTKTTDTAGSGTWTPQGVPTHHYSTDEQVIGTWIDGRTIYGKVFALENSLTINADSWGTTSISNSDKSFIVDARLYDVNGTFFGQVGANCDATSSGSQYVQILNSRNAAISINKIYLEYIKTS